MLENYYGWKTTVHAYTIHVCYWARRYCSRQHCSYTYTVHVTSKWWHGGPPRAPKALSFKYSRYGIIRYILYLGLSYFIKKIFLKHWRNTGKKISFKELRVVKKLLRLNRYVGKVIRLKNTVQDCYYLCMLLFTPSYYSWLLLFMHVTVHT
jgi:hypothetical protein